MKKLIDPAQYVCDAIQVIADTEERSFVKMCEILLKEALTNRKTK